MFLHVRLAGSVRAGPLEDERILWPDPQTYFEGKLEIFKVLIRKLTYFNSNIQYSIELLEFVKRDFMKIEIFLPET
jgi:hypothetical protein